MDGRLFGLDFQLLFDVLVMFIFLMILFLVMSRLFFIPVRKFIEARQAGIDKDLEQAAADRQQVEALRASYDEKLALAEKEAQQLLSSSRREALAMHEAVIEEARQNAEAVLVSARTALAERKAAMGPDVKREMAALAGCIAAEYVSAPEDPFHTAMLVNETLGEIGGDTWLG